MLAFVVLSILSLMLEPTVSMPHLNFLSPLLKLVMRHVCPNRGIHNTQLKEEKPSRKKKVKSEEKVELSGAGANWKR